jgi:hypothetical protein
MIRESLTSSEIGIVPRNGMYHLRTGTDPINVSFSEQRAIPPPCVMQTAMSGMHWKLTGARLAQANLSLPPKTSHYILTDGGVADRHRVALATKKLWKEGIQKEGVTSAVGLPSKLSMVVCDGISQFDLGRPETWKDWGRNGVGEHPKQFSKRRCSMQWVYHLTQKSGPPSSIILPFILPWLKIQLVPIVELLVLLLRSLNTLICQSSDSDILCGLPGVLLG